MTATYEVRGAVAVVTLDNPPVNSLGYETRKAVAAAVEEAEDEAAVTAIVITGGGTAFCGGADIKEFGSPTAMAEPSLPSLIARIEGCTKPVIAAINGVCMGGGLELSLGCHYRVVSPGVQIALPEVKLGLVPGAGGTQRLPRALGVEAALNMIVNGEPVKSDLLAQIPEQKLIDRVIVGDVLDGAIAFATEISATRPLPALRNIKCKHPEGDAYFGFARNTVKAMSRNFPAPLRCVDCVERATRVKLDDGLIYEREAFFALMSTPESKALRHAFFAERAASKIPGIPEDTPVRDISKIAIIGAGTMGGGIAMNFLNAGVPVILLEMTQEALDKGLAIMRGNYEGQVKKGKLNGDKYTERMALLSTTLSYAGLGDADLVIEAVYEEIGVKQKVFEQLDAVMKPGAILASNTSTLDLDKIASFTKRPQDVIGMHFFSPANVMRLLEVVRGAKTAPDVLITVMKLGKRIKKTCVVSGVCDGFIGNRMIEQYSRQAGFLLDEGCSPQQVDKAIEKFGFAMGPFRMIDLAGNDIAWAIRKRRYSEKPNERYSKTADLLCELGRFGQKTGAGWYDYVPGKREAVPSELVNDMLGKHRVEQGIAPRKVSDEEIVHRLVYALVNEGARIVQEGIALRASDVDMVYLSGYGFPLWRGGPMNYADTVGPWTVVQTMKKSSKNPHGDPAFWQPAPLLVKLAAEAGTFS